MACAAPASRTSHEGKERGHPHGAQAGKGTSNGRVVTGSQMQEVVPTSELGSSARQAAVVVVRMEKISFSYIFVQMLFWTEMPFLLIIVNLPFIRKVA